MPNLEVTAKRSSPRSKEWWLHERRRADRSYSIFKVRRENCEEIPASKKGAVAVLCWSSCEEIPHVQGKRNPSKMISVVRGIRGQTHKP